MTESNITLRLVAASDDEFLRDLYCSTRRAEVAQFGWDQEQAEAFLRMQFASRRMAYKMQFPSAEHEIILFGEMPAGCMIVDRSETKLSLIDIAVLPQFQGRGIASHLVRQLQDESAKSAILLVLRVDKVNLHAFNLYKKLGFEVTGETQIMYQMTWTASLS